MPLPDIYIKDIQRQKELEEYNLYFLRFTENSIKYQLLNVLRTLEIYIEEFEMKKKLEMKNPLVSTKNCGFLNLGDFDYHPIHQKFSTILKISLITNIYTHN